MWSKLLHKFDIAWVVFEIASMLVVISKTFFNIQLSETETAIVCMVAGIGRFLFGLFRKRKANVMSACLWLVAAIIWLLNANLLH